MTSIETTCHGLFYLCKRLSKAEASAELEVAAEDFRKLKMRYVRTVGYLILSIV